MGIVHLKYVTVSKFSELTGYSEKAVRNKISTGTWIEGIHYLYAPDNRIQMDMDAHYRWVEGEKLAEAFKKAAINAIG